VPAGGDPFGTRRKRAGVSPRNVSNVERPPPRGTSDAAKAQALPELDYPPNLPARGLRQGRTDIVTLLVSDLSALGPTRESVGSPLLGTSGARACVDRHRLDRRAIRLTSVRV
jgi:hypothetical protein